MDLDKKKSLIEIIPLHFDILEHSLPLDEFIETARSTKAIIENFNQELFEGKLKYQILVIPPEDGGFISRIAIYMILANWGFLNTTIGDTTVKHYTDHDVAYWTEAALKKLDNIKNINDEDILKKSTSIILAEGTKGFLQKDINELRKVGISKERYRNAYEARNEFYQSCINNREIKGLGFDNSHKFPIKRSDFPKLIVSLPEATEKEEKLDWKVEVRNIKITSPDWEKHRQWSAKYDNNKVAQITIEDEVFWNMVELKRLKPKIIDNLQVQWAFILEGRKHRKFRVLRVLKFNGKKISKKLSGNDLKEVLNNYSILEELQTDLFTE